MLADLNHNITTRTSFTTLTRLSDIHTNKITMIFIPNVREKRGSHRNIRGTVKMLPRKKPHRRIVEKIF